MAERTPKKPKAVKPANNGDLGRAVFGLAKEVAGGLESIAEELRRLRYVEDAADSLSELASALHGLANATALSVVAQYGSNEDRAAVVDKLKRWFEEFR